MASIVSVIDLPSDHCLSVVGCWLSVVGHRTESLFTDLFMAINTSLMLFTIPCIVHLLVSLVVNCDVATDINNSNLNTSNSMITQIYPNLIEVSITLSARTSFTRRSLQSCKKNLSNWSLQHCQPLWIEFPSARSLYSKIWLNATCW